MTTYGTTSDNKVVKLMTFVSVRQNDAMGLVLASFGYVTAHYIYVLMSAMAYLITSVSLTQPSVQAQIKENIKVPRYRPLWGEFTGDRWIPAQQASNTEMFPFDDVIMEISKVYFKDTSWPPKCQSTLPDTPSLWLHSSSNNQLAL